MVTSSKSGGGTPLFFDAQDHLSIPGICRVSLDDQADGLLNRLRLGQIRRLNGPEHLLPCFHGSFEQLDLLANRENVINERWTTLKGLTHSAMESAVLSADWPTRSTRAITLV